MTNIDWNNLGFDIIKTNSILIYKYSNKKWDNGTFQSSTDLNLNVYSSVLHYGQACFEGLKAFTSKDGKVRIFRPHLNAKRIQSSCIAASMPYPDEHLFIDAVQRVVKDNIEFVPPYGCDGSLYIRPFVFGSGPMLGLQPSDEYYFIVYVNPVGSYYKGGIVKPSKALIQHGFDRAAPFGMGSVKLAGNYAPTLLPTQKAIEKGYTVLLFLDSKTNKYVEEFATSNFAALTKPDANGKRTYVTPLSNSILASVTNRSLSELAANHFNWAVERRQVEWSEIQTGQFDEICACGTAVVITPIGQIDREIPQNPINPTPKTDIATMWDDDFEEPIIKLETVKLGDDVKGFKMLYDLYRQIQNGDVVDKYNWMYPAQGL